MIQHSTGASDSVLTAIIAAVASIVVALVPSYCTKKADLETIPPKPSAECNEDFAFSVPELIQELELQARWDAKTPSDKV